GGDFTGKMAARLANWVAKQYRRGNTVVVPLAVRDGATPVGVLKLLPLRGMSAWAQRMLGVDDLVAFAWVGSGERLVAVDAGLLMEAGAKRARLDERLGTAGAGLPAPVRGRAAARQRAMQAAAEGWAQLPDAELGKGDAVKWDVWRLLGALLRADAPRLSHP